MPTSSPRAPTSFVCVRVLFALAFAVASPAGCASGVAHHAPASSPPPPHVSARPYERPRENARVPGRLAATALGYCAATTPDHVYCWGGMMGRDARGNLYPPEAVAPYRVEGLRGVRAITCGAEHCCALVDERTLRCWSLSGTEPVENLRDLRTRLSVPVAVDDDVASLNSVASRTCVTTRAGAIRCWSLRRASGDLVASAAERQDFSIVRRLSRQESYGCILSTRGRVGCWGSVSGEDERALAGPASTRPYVIGGLERCTDLSTGLAHACAVCGGQVFCWGNNRGETLGVSGVTTSEVPVRVPGTRDVVSVAAGTALSCAVRASGTVLCWGGGLHNATLYRVPDAERLPSPVEVPGLREVEEVAVGFDSMCALSRSGDVLCWGDGRWGQNGRTDRYPVLTPQRVVGPRDVPR